MSVITPAYESLENCVVGSLILIVPFVRSIDESSLSHFFVVCPGIESGTSLAASKMTTNDAALHCFSSIGIH